MNSGAILLVVILLVAISDLAIALYFRHVPDRAEMDWGDGPIAKDPAATQRTAILMQIFAPIMWAAAALMSIGVVPVNGIDPIKLQAE